MKHIKELDIRFIGDFTETQFNKYMNWFGENGEIIDKLIVSKKQIQIMHGWLSIPEPFDDKTIKVYTTNNFHDILIKVI
jgi:hypothetical protein